MKAMILAAGRGERMRPLTDNCPKPLLQVRGRPLIVWHILNLVRAGIVEIVINHAHLGALIESSLGDGSQFGAQIHYSREGTALETAGGIANALPLLGDEPFVVVNGDIWCPHFDFEQVKTALVDADMWGNPYPEQQRDIGWLYLVNNPPHVPDGDFGLTTFSINNDGMPKFTFSGIAVYRPAMFADIVPGAPAKLAPILRAHAARGQLGGDLFRGEWVDVGTPERLALLNRPLSERSRA
ncbi:MAG: nucleotidyltransferase family protein [Pseudomonadota bacterium]|nr:nucleotidyltransferase family protein [Pseudomonadota bacterium]